jgi:hypothetical protein
VKLPARALVLASTAGVFQLAVNSREQRLAENQRAFRLGNERLRSALETKASAGAIPFLCECMDQTCMGRVDLTLDEYGDIRTHENRFLIIRDHPTLPHERVVQENGTYQIVEK